VAMFVVTCFQGWQLLFSCQAGLCLRPLLFAFLSSLSSPSSSLLPPSLPFPFALHFYSIPSPFRLHFQGAARALMEGDGRGGECGKGDGSRVEFGFRALIPTEAEFR
jgi:hypothetical protein